MLLSVNALYNYDDTIFDNWELPINVSRETLIGNVLIECGELSLIYTVPSFMKEHIKYWSRRRLSIWEKLLETTEFDYNPIENYNRVETGTKSGTESGTRAKTDSRDTENERVSTDTTLNTRTVESIFTPTVTETEQLTAGIGSIQTDTVSMTRTDNLSQQVSGTSSTTTSRAAFNSAALEDVEEVAGTNSATTTNTGTVGDAGTNTSAVTRSGSDTTTRSKTGHDDTNTTDTLNGTVNGTVTDSKAESGTENVTEQGTKSETYSNTVHGNIGVMSTQEMIRQEREIDQFDIYWFLVQDFKAEFCTLVY